MCKENPLGFFYNRNCAGFPPLLLRGKTENIKNKKTKELSRTRVLKNERDVEI